jgi:hypothetical protein
MLRAQFRRHALHPEREIAALHYTFILQLHNGTLQQLLQGRARHRIFVVVTSTHNNL